LIELCGSKGIRRDYSNARTPQQNGVAKRKNQTLIEAARTMLADSLLFTIFWSEAVATACYVLNRVLVTKPYHKTPYELLTGDKPSITTTQNDDIKSDLAQLNADNLDELAELQALQSQEQAGKEEADRLGLVFPTLNIIPIDFASRPVSAGRPPGSTGRPVSAGRPSDSADRSSVPAGHILGQSNASTSSERFSRASSMNKSDIHD
nr:putative ribonuclease H-like domain-containing protein [Tanacetum cinerariifolium]